MTEDEAANGVLTDQQVIALLDSRQAWYATVYGEARGEILKGISGVAWVIRNRHEAGKWGPTIKQVCLARAQFSCWWNAGGATNRAETLRFCRILLASAPTTTTMELVRTTVDRIAANQLADPTHGARYYMTRALYYSPGRPSWAEALPVLVEIGRHIFLGDAHD